MTEILTDVGREIKIRASSATHLVAPVKCNENENFVLTEVLKHVRSETKNGHPLLHVWLFLWSSGAAGNFVREGPVTDVVRI